MFYAPYKPINFDVPQTCHIFACLDVVKTISERPAVREMGVLRSLVKEP